MTDTARPAGPAPEEISEWANGGMAKQIAADLARKINSGQLHRYRELPLNSELADDWDVSERTVSVAKKILGDHRILKLENRRYYVA
jgi:DNA-binding GntR family transcriptional regulator